MKISEVLNKHNNARAVMLGIESDLTETYKKYKTILQDVIDSGFKSQFVNRFKKDFSPLLDEFESQANILINVDGWEYPNDPGLRQAANRANKQLTDLNNLRQQVGV